MSSEAFRQQATQRSQGMNTCLRRVILFARKKAKFGPRKRKFERSDYFLDNLIYINNGTFKYVASFLYWSFFEMPKKTISHEKGYYYFGTEGVLFYVRTYQFLKGYS